MHIAVCMDDAADRKQLERLLGRSADARLRRDSSIPFYIQSYGSIEAILSRPFMYDLFFIDILKCTMDSVQLIHELRNRGVTAVIVLCPDKVDLSDRLTKEDNCLILRQPILVRELDEVMDIAVEYVKNKVPRLSVRTGSDTVYLTQDEFLFAQKNKDSITVFAADGRNITVKESLKNFYERAVIFEKIKPVSDTMIVNSDYVESTGFASVTLKDHRKYRASRNYLKKYFEK